VYGSKVTVSPTEDSLLLRVLVRFSSLILIMKCVLPVCFQTICLICWWSILNGSSCFCWDYITRVFYYILCWTLFAARGISMFSKSFCVC
jgi:hypothetical protein